MSVTKLTFSGGLLQPRRLPRFNLHNAVGKDLSVSESLALFEKLNTAQKRLWGIGTCTNVSCPNYRRIRGVESRLQYQKIASPPAKNANNGGFAALREPSIELQGRKKSRIKITGTEPRVHEKESRCRIDWLRGALYVHFSICYLESMNSLLVRMKRASI